jgi:hypothetical protein
MPAGTQTIQVALIADRSRLAASGSIAARHEPSLRLRHHALACVSTSPR